jgi:hypothetical protein
VTRRSSRALQSGGKLILVATRLVVVQLRCTLHPDGNDRRLVGSTLTTAPPRHLIHELVAINAKFFVNEKEKTLEPPSSDEEKRTVSPTDARGPLLTCTRQGILATCRTR